MAERQMTGIRRIISIIVAISMYVAAIVYLRNMYGESKYLAGYTDAILYDVTNSIMVIDTSDSSHPMGYLYLEPCEKAGVMLKSVGGRTKMLRMPNIRLSSSSDYVW